MDNEEHEKTTGAKQDVPVKKKSRAKVITLAVVVVILFIGCSIAALPLMRALTTESGQQAILDAVGGLGVFRYLIYFGLQVVQIVIAMIPGGPIPLIGGMLFGEWMTLILSLAGCFVGTAIVYYLVQAVGKPLVHLFVSEEQLRTYRFLQDEKRLEIFIFLFFLCPGLPKDALTYIAALTPIKPMRLFLLTTLGRTPALIATIWLGGSLWKKDYVVVAILIGVMVVAAVAGLLVKKKIEQRHKQKQEPNEK
jgi:uncharacterized membrane protein YdjX (TVP38/TMEM64 family)